jgi:nucleotide-binding universal stress UspA family protein
MTTATVKPTLVVATDFSDDAACAIGWATEIARQHEARVALVHAFAADAMPAPEYVPLPPQYYEQIHGEAKERLAAEAARVRAAGVEVQCELVLSHPVIGVLDVARRQGASLIVAGTRGRTGWKRALLGSTAGRLVRDATCPVLTVHHRDGAQPRALRTILVPTDFSEDAALAADAAARFLCVPGDGHELVLLHAYRIPIDAMHLPASVLAEAVHRAAQNAAARLEELAAALRRPGLAVRAVAHEGYPPDVVLAQAAALGADLIAMGTHGRSGIGRAVLGSTAERVIATAPCPVLTVRRPHAA